MAEEYEEFLAKFEIKKTTDDCYTPENIYNAVLGWVCNEYGINRADVVRPFWPNGDYENYEYSDAAVVVDNPPFSIISRIISFFDQRRIKFFLFAPALTLLSPMCDGYCGLSVGATITYENGARIATSFATNLEEGRARSCPALYRLIGEVNKENERKIHRELPRYQYPDNVVTVSLLQKLSKYDIDFRIPKGQSKRISALDSQKAERKTIFGKGLLVSDTIAAEKAAAEKAAAEKVAAEKENKVCWELSKREKEIVRSFEKGDN